MKKLLSLLTCMVLLLSCMSLSALAEDDDFVNGRFATPHKITVEIFDRGNDGGSDPANNKFTKFIQDKMLEYYNVEVEFQKVPRWTEVETLNNLLAAGTAPDVCYTYSYETITAYASMDGVINLNEYIEKYRSHLDNLFNLVGEECVYYHLDKNTDELWAIEGRGFNSAGQTTFIREDWLKKLGLEEPSDLESFTACLRAFRDNAEILLGADASQMIPMMVTSDASWYIIELARSFIPNDITDKDWYVYGYDDRCIMYPGYKEALRVVNGWYNEGLLWKDFALYNTSETTVVDNKFKAGYVGAFIQGANQPYRNGENSYQVQMKAMQGEDAAYIAVATFKNDAGVHKKYMSVPVDRNVFFPASNDEILASLLYVDFISSQEALTYLQAGDEGINHEVREDGAVALLSASGPDIVNSKMNIDYTMTCNGLHLESDELTMKSFALTFPGIEPEYIQRSYSLDAYEVRTFPAFSCGNIEAEEGMSSVLTEKRNIMMAKAITCSVEKFDSMYDSYYSDYLASGGQAIIDERAEAWKAAYGDVEMLGE